MPATDEYDLKIVVRIIFVFVAIGIITSALTVIQQSALMGLLTSIAWGFVVIFGLLFLGFEGDRRASNEWQISLQKKYQRSRCMTKIEVTEIHTPIDHGVKKIKL